MRKLIIPIALIAAALAVWYLLHRTHKPVDVRLYGNVDLRQVSLAFNSSERIAEVLVEEGDKVRKGQTLARLETARITPRIAQAEAQVAAQQAAVDQLKNGSRPKEIAQASAQLQAARADASNAQQQYDRRVKLASAAAITAQELDSARAAADGTKARVDVAGRALELLVAGPRIEQFRQAAALLRSSEAQLAQVRQQLADTELISPIDGVVRARLMEPGEMTTAARPVFALAATSLKWVRAYLAETRLSQVRPGMKARVTTDSRPDAPYTGWVGFVSPIAEFTPRTVQTEDLRTSLVYEIRVFVNDPSDTLRLGMPATVELLGEASAPAERRP